MTTASTKSNRLLFIDNIRVFLTILVILHHLMVIYSHDGGWIYYDNRQDDITALVGRWFCGVNQSYFMGLFLFISAYFVPGAFDRKGGRRFLKDRFIRLGIPLALYAWFIRPVWYFFTFPVPGGYWKWFTGDYFRYFGYIGGGPLWFIEVLLIFACFYALFRVFKPKPIEPIQGTIFPRSGAIILFAFLLGIASFIIRLWFPRDTTIAELNLELANFPQYIALFILGLMAYPRNWLMSLDPKIARRWMWVAGGLSVLPLIVGFNSNPQAGSGVEMVFDLVSAWWESFMCVAMCISVLYVFRTYADQQGKILKWFSGNAYTAYLIHESVITSVALAIAILTFHPLLKFAIMALVNIPLTFLVSALIRKIPYTDRVL